MSATDAGFLAALKEAQEGLAEGGIPVGAAIVNKQGEIIGKGRNSRIQTGSVILHGETAAFENAKHLRLADFQGATLYTTLSPCPMCTGIAIHLKIARIIIAENKNMTGQEDLLRQKGIEVILLNHQETEDMMSKFIRDNPDKWEEGVPNP